MNLDFFKQVVGVCSLNEIVEEPACSHSDSRSGFRGIQVKLNFTLCYGSVPPAIVRAVPLLQ